MSSPSHRRQRSSQSGTPRRTSKRSNVPSSPPDPAAAQLHSEAASSQGNGTPRRAAAPPSSSPMNYRSSPADIARMNRERDVSSPLRQMTNTQTTQEDGERTPRATTSGLIGGNTVFYSSTSRLKLTFARFFPYSICAKFQPERCRLQCPSTICHVGYSK